MSVQGNHVVFDAAPGELNKPSLGVTAVNAAGIRDLTIGDRGATLTGGPGCTTTDTFAEFVVHVCSMAGITQIVEHLGDRNDKVFEIGAPGQAVPVRIDAGAGNDDITTARGNSVYIVNGDGGNDTISTDTGADRINGGAGSDTITARSGKNVIVGGAGSDKLSGSGTLKGGTGNDQLTAPFKSSDKLFGGPGKDKLFGVDNAKNSRDTLNCGSGKKDTGYGDHQDKLIGCESKFN